MIVDMSTLYRGRALLSRDGRIMEWDAGAEHMLGWSRTELVGRDFISILVRPEDQDRFRHDLLDAAGSGGCPVVGRQWVTPLKTLTGSRRVRWAVSPRPPWRADVVLHLDVSVGSLGGEGQNVQAT